MSQEKGKYAKEATIQAADNYVSLNNTDKARQVLERASTMGQPTAQYHTVRARLLQASGDDVGAQDAIKLAINADPAYAPAYLENGLMYIKRDALTEGVEQLDRYLSLVGENAEGTQAKQIRELVNQLQQTVNR